MKEDKVPAISGCFFKLAIDLLDKLDIGRLVAFSFLLNISSFRRN